MTVDFDSLRRKITQIYAKNKTNIRLIIYVVWFLLFSFILWTVWKSRDQLLPFLLNADYKQFIFVIAIYLVALLLAVINWTVIIRAFESNISWWDHIQIYLATMVSRRLPGTIWYVGGRMVLYKRLGVSSVVTASASGVEFVVGFVADCILAAIFLPFGLGLSNYWIIPLGLVAGLGLIMIHPKVLSWILAKLKRPLVTQVRFTQIIGWLILRILLVLTGGVMIFQTVRIFYPMSWSLLLVVLGARALSGAAGMLTFFLPSSMGASELTLIVLLTTVVPTSLAAVIALFVRIYTSLFELIFGLIFFVIVNRSSDPKFSANTFGCILPEEEAPPDQEVK